MLQGVSEDGAGGVTRMGAEGRGGSPVLPHGVFLPFNELSFSLPRAGGPPSPRDTRRN